MSELSSGMLRRHRSSFWPLPSFVGAAALVLASSMATPLAVQAQEPAPVAREVTLEEALEIARMENAALGVARAEAEMEAARSLAATSTLLPAVDLRSDWLRTVDPVAAFGTKLRQGVFGPDDLSIPVLNDPDALTDASTTASVRWGVASPRRWADRSAAQRRAEAREWSAERVREATDMQTRVLYFRTVQAGARVEAAAAAERAAEATLERFERQREEGMITEADVLQARAERDHALAGRIAAEQDRTEARIRLGLHLGWGPETVPVPVDSFGEPTEVRRRGHDVRGRPDLRARERAVEAARAARTGARLSWAPSLDGFAAYSLRGDAPFSDRGTDWTAGVTLRWNVFSGLRRSARNREADARLVTEELEYGHALREARGEVETATRAVEAARRRVQASRTASEAAREGRDLMRRRFQEGLATPSDLLQAEARAAEMRVRAMDALADYHVARARLRFVRPGEKP